MEWTGSAKAVFCLLIFLQLSCHQCMADEVPLTICVDQDLTFTADSNLHLFIDGVEVSLQYSSFPGNADTTLLPASAKVIAVSGQNEVVNGGFLGSSGTFVTDASWKCTDQHHDGWQGVGFDDSAWQQAYEVRLHGDSPWYVVEGIRLDARWIWIKPEGCIPEGIINVYCRKRLADTCIAPPIQCSTPAPTTTTTTPVPTTTTTTTPVPTTTTTTPVPTTTTTTPVPTTTTTTPVPTTTTTTPVPTTTTTTPVPTTTTTTPVPTTTTTTPVPTTTTTTTTTTTPAPTTTTKPPLSCQPQPTPPPGCSGTGPTCITSCTGLGDGDYQSCRGCNVYATCSNGYLTDGRPCAACLFWDDNVKRCEYTSTTCAECPGTLCSGTGAACIGSCRGRADGDYQSCKGWDVYATCSNGRMNDRRPCAAGRPAM